MEHKIPPPLIMLVGVLVMWLVAWLTNSWRFTIPAQSIAALAFFIAGFLVTALAAFAFKRASTTVNPLAPEKASNLVTTGVFRFSRNPMYLGMLLVLIAWFFHLGSLLNLVALFFFVLFITRFQIEPEERAMHKLFPDQFPDYCQKVRRWI